MDDDAGVVLLILFAWGVVNGAVGMIIGEANGRTGASIAACIFGGPIGWLIATTMRWTPEMEARYQIAVDRARDKLEQNEVGAGGGAPGSDPDQAEFHRWLESQKSG